MKEKIPTYKSPKISNTKKNVVPLIIEPHPKDYSGFPFITLVQYRRNPMLVIVDNADDDILQTFILDLCGPEDIDEEALFSAAVDWYENNRTNFPISIEFSKRGLTSQTTKIYRTLNMEFVSRIIGPVPKYPMKAIKSIKRRRRKVISPIIEVQELKTTLK